MAYTCPVALSLLTRANKGEWISMLMNWTNIRCTRDAATGQPQAGVPVIGVVRGPGASPLYPFSGGNLLRQAVIEGLAITDRRYQQL
jgi:hypothetical protein